MDNSEKIFKSELIPLLIKYKQKIGFVFPIEKLKYLSTDDIIKNLKYCISTNTKFDFRENNFNSTRKKELTINKQLMSDSNLKKVIPLIKLSMERINYNYEIESQEFLDIIDLKNNGKEFSFAEHLRALIITLLSNHRWGDSNIRDNKYKIDYIFHNYDKNYLKQVDPSLLVKELKKKLINIIKF